MRIGFHLNNIGQESVDCTNVVDCNPGIGGSEYLILSISTLLTERKNNLDIILYAQKNGKFPISLKCVVIDNIEDAINRGVMDCVDIMVVDNKRINEEIINKYRDNMSFVLWCHNFVLAKQLSFYSKMPNVLRLINVGLEQMDLYRDHTAFEKSDFIYNGLSILSIDKHKNNITIFSKRKNNVIYIGSLVECKGFHYLAKAWKKVLKYCPDANLYVVGSGKLYNRNNILGDMGIAEKSYEQKIISYLTENNEILPSVHFMGVLGNEKFDLLSICKVGVPNPGGETETFGLAAVEMQLMGCLVTTIKCPGYLDTVFDKDALYNNTSILADNIIKMLKRTENNYDATFKFLHENFSFDVVIPQWEKLFIECIPKNLHLHDPNIIINHPNYRFKMIKELVRIKRRKWKLLAYAPLVEFVLDKTLDRFHRLLGK